MTRLIEFSKTVYSRTIKPLREAGSKVFSEENWSKLKAAAALIKKPPLASIEQVHGEITRLKKSLSHKEADNLDVAAYLGDWHDLIQPSYRRWQVQQMKFLNDSLWWDHSFEKIKKLPVVQRRAARKRLRQLQKNWELQSVYAHYSTLEVIYIYQTVIPVFFAWLQDAKRELEKIKVHLTFDSQFFYENYLEWFERALEEEKELLRSSMQERLEIGLKKGYGAWDKIIESLRDELKNIGDLASTSELDKSLVCGHLTPEAFVTILKIIEADGNEEEKIALHNLAYYHLLFSNDLHLADHKKHPLNYCAYQHSLSRNDTMSIKSTVYRYLPRFLQWLFWDEEVREQFFQHPNHQFLLAQEAAFLNTEVNTSTTGLTDLLEHPAWQEHELCLSLLQNEQQRIEQWLKHPLAFLFSDTIRQLEDYRKTIEQSVNSWMIKRLKLLKQSLENKENDSLNAQDKTVLTTALVEIEVMQKQWTFSKEVLTTLAEIKKRYQELCDSKQDEIPLSSPEPIASPLPPLRDQFRIAIAQAIRVFEVTHIDPIPELDPLKNQLEVDVARYDSVALHFWLTDYLKEEIALPDQLKVALQGVLEQMKFSEAALNHSENIALSALKQPSSSFSLPHNPTADHLDSADNTFPVLNEHSWKADSEKFTQHCLALKNAVIPLTDPASITWNQKLCEYTLAFLKEIQTLEKWEDFVLHRKQMNELLQVLIDISATHFPALHQSLTHLTTAEKILDEDSWDLFIEFSLAIPIKTLSGFLQIENRSEMIAHNEAASFESQKTFSFLKRQNSHPDVSCVSTDLPINQL